MGLLRGVARTAAVAGTATAVVGGVRRHQQKKYAAQDQEQAQAEEVPAPDAEPASPDDQYAELEKLSDLKDKGILTQEEFDAKKKQILGI